MGTGIFMPRATKNSVTKKSRTPVTLEMTSDPYGKDEMLRPAMSAPISRDRPRRSAAPLTRKHHPTAEISTSSGRRAAASNTRDSTWRLVRKATATRTAPPAIDQAIVSTPGCARLGCTAMNTMAQMSWTTSTPRVRRPDSTFSSNLSRRSLTTMRVELSEMTMAR